MNRVGLVVSIVILSCLNTYGDWPSWRGPNGNGSGTGTNLPITWSVETGENILWTRRLFSNDSASPIVGGGRLYLSSCDSNDYRLFAECIDAGTGKTLWKKTVGIGRKNAKDNSMASPSPIVGGAFSYFLYGNGVLACFDRKGLQVWKRELEKDYGLFDIKFSYAASPLLYKNRLYISVLRSMKNNQDSYLLCLEAASGKTLWKQKRKPENIEESVESYSTPMVYTLNGKSGIIVSGADIITCHDPLTGKEMWRYFYTTKQPGWWRLVPTPVQAGDNLCFTLPRGKDMQVITCPGNDVTAPPVLAWKHTGYIPDVPSPAYKDGLLYVLDDKKRYLSCFDSKTGQSLWAQKLKTSRGKGFYASPTVADGHIYCISLAGDVFVCAEGRTPRLLSQFSIGNEYCSVLLTVSGSSLFLRTPTRLMCLKSK